MKYVDMKTKLQEAKSAKAEARVTEQLKIDLRRKCNELNLTESNYVMLILAARLYGDKTLAEIEASALKTRQGNL